MSGVVDLGLHRANAAAHNGMRKLRALRGAEERYRKAKAKRAMLPPGERCGSPESRECLSAAEAVRDASRALTKALEEWERASLPMEADCGG